MDDPSEFADTLEKEEGAINAGELEDLLKQETFEHLDLTRQIDDIHLTVYNLKEASARWVEIGFANLTLAWDEQAVKMSEHKETYTLGRRALATKVKAFTQAYLTATATATATDTESSQWRKDCEELIEEFKKQFDSLSSNSRFTEVSFLSTYRLLRSAEDPTVVMDKCLKACINAQEALKNAQEQLNLAAYAINGGTNAATLNFSLAGGSSLGGSNAVKSSSSIHELEARDKQHAKEKEELEQRMREEVAELRTRFEVEMRSREHDIRSAFERHEMESQAAHDELLARKEAEVQSLINTVSDYSHRAAEAEERGITLQLEVGKRRELEDRLRAALTETADAQTLAREFQTKFEDTLCHAQAVEARSERDSKKAAHDTSIIQSELRAAREAISNLELEMVHRPPVDLTGLAETMGVELGVSNNNSDVAGSSGQKLQWTDIETFVRENVRRINAEAAESRVQAQEATRRLTALEEECTRLRGAVQHKDEEVAALERDLMAAQNIIESNKALAKAGVVVGLDGRSGGDDAPTSTSHASNISNSNSNKTPTKQSVFQARSPRVNNDIMASSVDVEKGAGGSGTAALIGSGQDGSDRMMQALQAQRDRFMRTAREKENELSVVKGRLDRLQEEQLTLRADNLELYRRLRVLRVSKGDEMEDNTAAKQGRRRDARSSGILGTVLGTDRDRDRDRDRDGAPSDPLDGKYTRLYESHLDPFKFEEVDRQLVISRLNILERGLAHLSRFLLQDRWARHALIVYLLLVHFFAIGYVLKILNPQLIEDVDFYSNQKYAAQTFETFEIEPDR